MKIVRYYELGGPEVLRIEEVETPQPKVGEVLVKVEAIDIGFVDAQVRRSEVWGRPTFPVTPGEYVYGRVVQLGEGVEGVREGEQVLGFVAVGAYAEYVVLPTAFLMQPVRGSQLSPAELVTLPVSGETAYHLLATSAQVRPGERVLVHAAGGGVPHFAVQLAKAMGAGQVIATAGSEEKLAFAQTLGADTLVNYTEPDWTKKVEEATEGKGVDVILDLVGGRISVESLSVLAPFGRLVVYGAVSGSTAALPLESLMGLMMGLRRVEGFSISALMQQRPDLLVQGRQALYEYVQQGLVHPRVVRTFGLSEIVEAHRWLESRAGYGKIVVCP